MNHRRQRAWAAQDREWHEIRDEMIAAGRSPTAHDVTLEQRKRLLARGERLVSHEEIIAQIAVLQSLEAHGERT